MNPRMKVTRTFVERHGATVGLTLTPLIDMFTILLVFLLMNYSVTDVTITPEGDLTLPYSLSETLPVMATKLVVSQKQIAVEGKKVLEVVDGNVLAKYKRGLTITPLHRELKKHIKIDEAVKKHAPDREVRDTILLQADKGISYRLLNEIMYTAGALGYLNFVLAVYKKDI